MGVPSLAFRAHEPRVGAHRVGEALRAVFLRARNSAPSAVRRSLTSDETFARISALALRRFAGMIRNPSAATTPAMTNAGEVGRGRRRGQRHERAQPERPGAHGSGRRDGGARAVGNQLRTPAGGRTRPRRAALRVRPSRAGATDRRESCRCRRCRGFGRRVPADVSRAAPTRPATGDSPGRPASR